MRPTLWELDSQTEKGGNLFISVLAYSDSLYPTFSAMKNDLKTFSNPIQKFQTPTLSFFFTWNML